MYCSNQADLDVGGPFKGEREAINLIGVFNSLVDCVSGCCHFVESTENLLK